MQNISREQVKLITIPRCVEQFIGINSNCSQRWIVIHYDPIIAKLPCSNPHNRSSISAVIDEEVNNASGDIQKFKLGKIRKEIGNIRSRMKFNQSYYGFGSTVIDCDNPCRIVDNVSDSGALLNGVLFILEHPRIKKSLDFYYKLSPGGFVDLFLSGDVSLLIDRLELNLFVGGIELLDVIESVNSCFELEQERDVLTGGEIKNIIEKSLSYGLIPIESDMSLDRASCGNNNIIHMQQFRRR